MVMRVTLYCSAIVFSCDQYIARIEARKAEMIALRLKSSPIGDTDQRTILESRGLWFWKRTIKRTEIYKLTAEEIAARQARIEQQAKQASDKIYVPQGIAKIRAIAAHHKPSMQLTLEGPELELIALDLAPSEPFAESETRLYARI